jgi:hypothetical protein
MGVSKPQFYIQLFTPSIVCPSHRITLIQASHYNNNTYLFYFMVEIF